LSRQEAGSAVRWNPLVVGDASGLPFALVDGHAEPPVKTGRRRRHLASKAVFDVLFSIFALALLSPLLVLIAIAVRLSSRGPIIFKQRRHGLNGVPFTMLKFRTLYVDREDPAGTVQAVARDARMTPFGRVLRRTSLDELPQILNVLAGHMSLVGPRPHAIGMLATGRPYEDLVPYYQDRFQMKPGLSGWAQINGLRGPIGDEESAIARIGHDIAYIQNFSMWLDLKIVVLTIRNEFIFGSGI